MRAPIAMALDTFSSDMTRARLRHAIGVLGGVSRTQAKRFEKAPGASLGNSRELPGEKARAAQAHWRVMAVGEA